MVIHDVDENAPWRNDPLAKRAVMAAREWNVQHRKGKEAVKPQQQAVIDYGMVLLEVRKQNVSNNKYKEDVLARRLDISPFDDYRQRVAALAIAKAVNVSIINNSEQSTSWDVNGLFNDCDAVTALHMAQWARKTGLIKPKKRIGTTEAVRTHVRQSVAEGKPINGDEVGQKTGAANGTVYAAIAMERARLEGVAEGEAVALNEQGKFTKVQAKHVEALIKKLQRDLHSQFTAAVEKQVEKQVAKRKAALESAREACAKQREEAFKDQQHWKALINNRKPTFTSEEFRAIVMALHPDNSASEETRARALQSVTDKKLQLTGKA